MTTVRPGSDLHAVVAAPSTDLTGNLALVPVAARVRSLLHGAVADVTRAFAGGSAPRR